MGCREQKGVKVRVELGPRDAQKSQACLAISTTPGEVAKKVIHQVESACLIDQALKKISYLSCFGFLHSALSSGSLISVTAQDSYSCPVHTDKS